MRLQSGGSHTPKIGSSAGKMRSHDRGINPRITREATTSNPPIPRGLVDACTGARSEGSHCRVGDTVLSARFLMLPGFTEDDPVCRSGYRRPKSNLKTVLSVGLRRAGNTRTAFVFTTGIHYAKTRLIDVHGIPSRFWARLPTQNQNVLDSPLHGLSNCPGCSPSDTLP